MVSRYYKSTPGKIRELEALLKKAGFVCQPGKGSHRKWRHPTGLQFVMSGNPAHDAKRYQEKGVAEIAKIPIDPKEPRK